MILPRIVKNKNLFILSKILSKGAKTLATNPTNFLPPLSRPDSLDALFSFSLFFLSSSDFFFDNLN